MPSGEKRTAYIFCHPSRHISKTAFPQCRLQIIFENRKYILVPGFNLLLYLFSMRHLLRINALSEGADIALGRIVCSLHLASSYDRLSHCPRPPAKLLSSACPAESARLVIIIPLSRVRLSLRNHRTQ